MIKHTSIELLWKETKKILQAHKERVWPDTNEQLLYKISQHTPQCLYASYFLTDSAPLFMSFHDAAGNANHHYHDFFEINYVIKGNPIGVIDGYELSLKPGNLYIMNPNAVHYFKAYEDDKDLVLNIVLPKDTFHRSIFLPLLGDPVLNAFFIRYRVENSQQPSFIYLEKLDPYIDYIFEMLIKEYLEKNHYTKVVIEALVTLLFSFILRSYDSHTKNKDNPIGDILDYIYQNYQHCSMEVLAEVFNYHPKYLSTLIRKYTGFTYRNLITRIKLQSSQHYLLYTDYTIEQIVAEIGYKEKSSFYNSFKKHYHKSPAEFRKAHLDMVD